MADENQNGAPQQDEGEAKIPAEGAETRTSERPAFRPRVDIYETEKGLTLIADLPGAAPGDIDVALDGRELRLSARTRDDAPEGLSPLWREYRTGDWERSFTLTGDVDTGAIEASHRDGVLTLTIPRAPEPEAKKIEVRAA